MFSQRKYLLIICLILSTCLFFVQSASNDRLKDAFSKSHNPGDGEPYSVNAEAKDLFDTQIDLVGSIGNQIENDGNVRDNIALSDSVFVRATRFMMKAAVVLAIPMIIFAALKLIFSLGDEGKLKEALKQVGYVALGIILALMSVMIIYLITSLTRSSLGGI